MRARTKIALLTVTVGLVLLNVDSARACTCGGGKVEPCQAYGSASAVFVGTVADVAPTTTKYGEGETEYRQRLFTFHVEESFSGVNGTVAQIVTGNGGGDCGYGFVKGASYLIYAYRDDRDNRLYTGICTPTKPIARATDELKFLRSITSRAPGVTLSGAVMTASPSGDDVKPPVDKRVVGLPVIIEGEGERRELRTDDEGRYQVTGLKAGTYTIKVVLPDDLYTYRAEEKVTIAERGCGGIGFFVSDNGRVSGRVMDTQGVPVSRIIVNVLPVEEVEKETPNMSYAQADEEGNFKFEALPPGRYLIGVRLSKYPQQGDPTNAFPRMYYPGVDTAAQAEAIIIGRGEHIKNFELRLLPRRNQRVLRGAVVWSDGRPVKNANVHYREVTYNEQGVNNAISADEQGRFTLEVYDGLTYVFGASSNTRYAGRPERVEPVRITVGEGSESVRIVIRPPSSASTRAGTPQP